MVGTISVRGENVDVLKKLLATIGSQNVTRDSVIATPQERVIIKVYPRLPHFESKPYSAFLFVDKPVFATLKGAAIR